MIARLAPPGEDLPIRFRERASCLFGLNGAGGPREDHRRMMRAFAVWRRSPFSAFRVSTIKRACSTTIS
ncbi:hypothetical protein PYK22_02611 [Pyrinomonas methylaliphatogenes]|uniref:Uncharacterized protein n=1 Tax=Pyrinomonas methylaliphatogenes TaxID=454194 RepID=A0A0B6X231_9BACT|nr:hypothetical protein PYK22_02611 [Pyrinomonas methylaliphatogenes]